MRTNKDIKEKDSVQNSLSVQKDSPRSSGSHSVQQADTQAEDESILTNAHEHFGNSIVQKSLAGEGSLLESAIHGSILSDLTGFGDVHRDTGNGEIQQVMRAQLRGRDPEESFPDASDARIQRIKESGGSSLPVLLRQKLESEFGHNFQHVRIHNSGSDAESAQALHAHAFTIGSHIFFGRGNYNPKSQNGMELLAHELTHVVQFDEGRIQSSGGEMEVSSPTDAVEVEAVQKGAEVARSISYSDSETLHTTGSAQENTTSIADATANLGYQDTNTFNQEPTLEESAHSSNTLLRFRSGNESDGGDSSEVIEIFIQEIEQGGRSRAEEMYQQAPTGERAIVEQAIRRSLGDDVATEIAEENVSEGSSVSVPEVESSTTGESPETIEPEESTPSSNETSSGGGSSSSGSETSLEESTPEEGNDTNNGLDSLDIDDLALIHQELTEHQSWSGAQVRVGEAGSSERAAFIAEQAGEGAISGGLEAAGLGFLTGGIGKLAARFIPIPGVGPILSGSMSAYGMIKDWDKTWDTIGDFGSGDSQYEVIANSIASISAIIDLVCNFLNALAGLIGAISAVMWIISIVTVGAASPLAATLSSIAVGIGVATGILDIINNTVLQPCVLLFRALHTFQNEADPRSVEAEGASIADASGKVAGFLGGAIGGKAGEAAGGAIGNRISPSGGNAQQSNAPDSGGDGPTTQTTDAPTAQTADAPAQTADAPAQTADAPAQTSDGPTSTSSDAPTQVPDTTTPALESPSGNIDTPSPQVIQAPNPVSDTPTSVSADTPTQNITAPAVDAPASQAIETTHNTPGRPEAQQSPAQNVAEIETEIQEVQRTGLDAIQHEHRAHTEGQLEAAQTRQNQIESARQRSQQQATDRIEAERQHRHQAINAEQQTRQQSLENSRSAMDENIRNEASERYIADIEAATQSNRRTHEAATQEFDQRRAAANTSRSERQALIDRRYTLQNVNEVEVRRQEQRRLAEIQDPDVRTEYESRWEDSRRMRQEIWEQEYNRQTRSNDQQYIDEVQIAQDNLRNASNRSTEMHQQAMQDARTRQQQTIDQAHRSLDDQITRTQTDADTQRSTVDTELEGRQGEVTEAGNRAASEAEGPALQQEAATNSSSREQLNNTRQREGIQAIRDGMRRERDAYIESENNPNTETDQNTELPEGYNRLALFGDPEVGTPNATPGSLARSNQQSGAGVKIVATALKADNNPNQGEMEKEASERRVSPTYEEPPGSAEQLDLLVQQIDQILAGRAEAEQAEQRMSIERSNHEANEAPIGEVVAETTSALSAQEAHQQAVSRTQEANRAQQERQRESQGVMDGYPERMAGLTVITTPLAIFRGFTSIASKLPGGAGNAMRRMNTDANQMSEAFSQMNSQMEAQSQGQEGHRAAIEADSGRLNDVSAQGQESRGNLETASQGAQGLSQANQTTIQNASEAENEAAQQGAQLDAAAEERQAEHQSLKDRLVTWARGHRDARIAANQHSEE